jgi:hypothetical protein
MRRGFEKRVERNRWIRKIDRVFSQYVRQSEADKSGNARCFTCEVVRPWWEMDCGHFQSRQYMAGRWLRMNAAVQCRECNVLSGEQYRFARRLDEVHGPGTAELIERLVRQGRPYTITQLKKQFKFWSERLADVRRNTKKTRG